MKVHKIVTGHMLLLGVLRCKSGEILLLSTRTRHWDSGREGGKALKGGWWQSF